MELIKYIFGDFWRWLGALLFIVVIINVVTQKKIKLTEHDPMDLPAIAPQGATWPYNGKKYIFVKDTWVQLSDTLLNTFPSATEQ